MILLLVVGRPFAGLKLPVMFAPVEDRAILPVMVTAPEGSSLAYLDRHMRELEGVLMEEVARGNVRFVNSRSGGFGRRGDVSTGVIFLPLTAWSERDEKASVIAERLRRRVAELPGLRISVIQPVGLGVRGGGKPLQVVLGGSDYAELAAWRDKVMARVQRENPRIVALESDYFERKPQAAVRIDRDRAADLGVSLATVGRTLESLLGSRIVTTFVQGGEEYNVVVQGRDDERASFDDLGGYYVRSVTTGTLVPLAALVHIEEMAGPTELKRFDRLRSITLSANLAPGYSLGEALDYIERVIHEEIPGGATINYDGESRELKQTGGRLWLTFGFALLIVYLVLAAQFESFIHPLVILATVPLALSGALVGLWLFRSSINVFSQIGAIMLIGIACKNGILIVEFANQLRDRGVEFREAVVQAATVRLRPVLMTSLCTACGAVPLMLATGAGAESRQSIGAAVFFGTVFSLALTLLVVPALYALIARRTQSPHHVSRLIERLAGAVSTGPGVANSLNLKD
ncbi:MAG: Toluene efflux pump membrane transporter TtgB [Steroidobacteraceae bacterium]|nr:Toluene efflux pump membrane transporter TtgB [Steroidobacteraceae bacterium]